MAHGVPVTLAKEFDEEIPLKIGPYSFLKIIGLGSTAVVCLMEDDHGTQVAVKIFSKRFLTSGRWCERFMREVQLLRDLNHPNIVRFVDLLDDERLVYVVMEYCPDGDLRGCIDPTRSQNENWCSSVFRQIISALAFLHANGIAHRDLKPENILRSGTFFKLADFGMSAIQQPGKYLNTRCGSPAFVAPEVITSESPYDGQLADMWSAGVLLYTMNVGRIPWDVKNEAQLIFQIQTARFHIPDHLSAETKGLINELMQPVPEARSRSSEILARLRCLGASKTWRMSHSQTRICPSSLESSKRPIISRPTTILYQQQKPVLRRLSLDETFATSAFVIPEM